MIRFVLAVILLFCSATFAQSHKTARPIGPSVAQNGDFEKGDASWPFNAVNGCTATGQVTKEQAHGGTQSFKITNKSAFAPNVYGKIEQIISGLEPFTTYRISCYVKGRNVGICWIGGGPGWAHRMAFPKGTYDWTYVENTWTNDATAGDYELMVATESPTEAVYVDDIKFEPLSVDAAKRDAVVAQHKTMLETQEKHLLDVRQRIAQLPGASSDATLHLGVYIAERYLDRVNLVPAVQSWNWSSLQIEEVDAVLKDTEKELDRYVAQHRTPQPLPHPLGGPVIVKDGIFYTDTSAGRNKPWFFYGMGHFDQVMNDLPNWHNMGVTIVQDGRAGPNSMEKDGTLRESGKRVVADLGRAGVWNVKTDYLLSPHYFPDWAWPPANSQEHKDLAAGSGTIYFNIDHPLAKDAVNRWADVISKAFKDHSALFSICLSNEPTYGSSGKNKESLPRYQAYLKEIHHNDIRTLNSLYQTTYHSFEEINAPTWEYTKEDGKNRAFYDWQRFNKKHFSDWHAGLTKTLKKNLPDIPTHAKIMVFFSMDRDKMGYGIDPEEFTAATDLAGCDAYAFPAGDYKTYDWRGEEFWYDLLNSFHNQPVFNSENHVIPDGTPAVHVPMTMTRAQFWQGALHHQGVTTTWVWEEAHDPSLSGSIFFRPANAYGAGRAFVDLGQFAEEVAAINQAPARIALLYSQPSIFWEEQYASTLQNTYAHLTFLGEKTTFVSESMLQSGRVPKVQVIAVPRATHVEDATVEALNKFIADGGKVLLVGDENLAFDQYHRPRNTAKMLADGPGVLKLAHFEKEPVDSQVVLRDLLKTAGAPPNELNDVATGKLAWNVEYRIVSANGSTLVPMIDFAGDAVAVRCPSLAGRKLVDLLSGESVDANQIKLDPMTPRLLRTQ